MNNVFQLIDRSIQRKSYEMNKILYNYSQTFALLDNLLVIYLECAYKFRYQLSMNSLKQLDFTFDMSNKNLNNSISFTINYLFLLAFVLLEGLVGGTASVYCDVEEKRFKLLYLS